MERVLIRIGIPGKDSRKDFPKEYYSPVKIREFLRIMFSSKVTERLLQELLNPPFRSASNYVHIYCDFTQLGKYVAYRKEQRFGIDFWIYPKIYEITLPDLSREGFKIFEARHNM